MSEVNRNDEDEDWTQLEAGTAGDDFDAYVSVEQKLAACGVLSVEEMCEEVASGCSMEEGQVDSDDNDEVDPKPVPSFQEALSAFEIMRVFIYAHEIADRDQVNIINIEKLLFSLKSKGAKPKSAVVQETLKTTTNSVVEEVFLSLKQNFTETCCSLKSVIVKSQLCNTTMRTLQPRKTLDSTMTNQLWSKKYEINGNQHGVGPCRRILLSGTSYPIQFFCRERSLLLLQVSEIRTVNDYR
ncbi:hypothetical protein ANN_26748 [Periplaneta americana]|uniref:Centromere protein CENP-B C-terminal domain-containing protein n=1 Tax=Periplaneta americana TaxID=6978 RepID=A0ABQ8RZ79_PERAM|nr:hypothetical protein ANN_26748 [Periplaneta americana]